MTLYCRLHQIVWSAVAALLLANPAFAQAPAFDEALFSNAAVGHPDWLRTVESRLTAPELVRSTYEQRRYVKGLNKPLSSSGRFILYRPLGLAWIQDSPFRIAHIVTPGGLIQKTFDRHRVDVLPAPNISATTQFSELLLSLFNGKLSSVSSAFTLYPRGDASKWQIGVQPKSGDLRRFIERAILEGTGSIERCTIREGSGDTVVTEFREIDTSVSELTADERALFQ